MKERFGKKFLDANGWKISGAIPTAKKYVLIAAPHTSNWDFPFTIATAFSFHRGANATAAGSRRRTHGSTTGAAAKRRSRPASGSVALKLALQGSNPPLKLVDPFF